MDYWLMFVLGVCAGSFLGVVLYRLRNGGSALKGRSVCDHCKKQLAWFDNIPLLSFLFLRGRCRFCRKPINPEYPLIELIIGIEFMWLYWLLTVNFRFFNSWEGFYSLALLIYWLILFSGSLVLAIFDWKYFLVADEILWPLVAIAGLRLFFSQQWIVLAAALGSAGFMGLLYLLVKKINGMGWGDVEIAFLMGLVLGWPKILVAYYLAFLTGSIVGVILIVAKKKELKDRIAFGPFLLAAMLIAKLWGEPIWQWYQKVLLF